MWSLGSQRKYEKQTEGNGNELLEKMLQFNSGGQNKERWDQEKDGVGTTVVDTVGDGTDMSSAWRKKDGPRRCWNGFQLTTEKEVDHEKPGQMK